MGDATFYGFRGFDHRPGRRAGSRSACRSCRNYSICPHYQPPPEPERELPGERRGRSMTTHTIRRALGKDQSTAKRLTRAGDALKFRAILKRIAESGR
jgi:hypothetical protein